MIKEKYIALTKKVKTVSAKKPGLSLTVGIILGAFIFALGSNVKNDLAKYFQDAKQVKGESKQENNVDNNQDKKENIKEEPRVNQIPNNEQNKEQLVQPKKENPTNNIQPKNYNPAPPLTKEPECDEGEKTSAINNENYQYQQLIAAENSYHIQRMEYLDTQRCHAGEQGGCSTATAEYHTGEPNRHTAKLLELETQHNTNVALINSTCY